LETYYVLGYGYDSFPVLVKLWIQMVTMEGERRCMVR